MAEEQDNVTPEEKLLNVIQSGGEEEAAPEEKLAEAASAPAEAPADAPSPVVEKSTPPEEKPALKLAPKDEEAKPEAAAEGEAPAADAPAAAAIGGAAPAAKAAPAAAMLSSKKKSGAHSGVKVINRMLAAGILILLGLSGFETFRVIKVRGAVKTLASIQIPDAVELTITSADVQRAYAIDPWWIDPGTIVRKPEEGPIGPRAPTAPWTDEMKHFKLMGVSMRDPKADSEAILMDTRDKRMYFIRLGDSVPISGVDVKLDDLETQRARFTDGRASIELK